MRKMSATEARKLDWREFPDSRPKKGVVYPKGEHKAALIASIRKALRKVKIGQAA